MQSPKRIKLTHAAGAETTDVKYIQDLPSEIFQHCLDFVGKGNFTFVAPVSKQFYWEYINHGVDRTVYDADTVLEQGRNKRTTVEAVSNGSLRLATECFLKAPKEFKKEVCRKAVVNGRVDILDCAVSFGVEMEYIFHMDYFSNEAKEAISQTLKNGHLDVIKFLAKEGVDFNNSYFFHYITEKRHARDLHWMMRKGIIDVKRWEVADYLARNDELDLLREHYADCITQETFWACARGGHVEVMNWMLQIRDCEWDEELFASAVRGSGNIPMLELCVQNGCPYSFYVSAHVIQDDKVKTLNVLQWLHSHGFPIRDNICNDLARHGNLEALKWARESGFDWDFDLFERTASSGDIDTLQYCLENGCPSSPSLYKYTPSESSKNWKKDEVQVLQIFKWLYQQGVPWDENVSLEEAESGHLSTLKWLLDHGCPCHDKIFDESIRRLDISMLGRLDLSMLECYLANVEHIGRDVYTYVMEAMENRNYYNTAEATVIQIFQLFRDYDIVWGEDLIATAEKMGRAKVARWLKCNGCPS